MGSAPITPSQALGRLLRGKRLEHGWTLAQVSERLAREGRRIPVSSLALIEQGRHDPGVLRLHRLLRLYNVPPHLVADLVEMEELAGEVPETGDLDALQRRGVEHWKRGDVGAALAHVIAVRERVASTPEARLLRQKAMLTFAIAAKGLGRLRLAREIVGDLLCEPPEAGVRVNVLVLASQVWLGLGSKDAAMAFLREAESHVDPGDRLQTAWVHHDKAHVLLLTDRVDDAAAALAAALRLYRKLSDTYGEARARLLEPALWEKRGDRSRAIRKASQAMSFAERHGHPQVGIAARLKLGRLRAEGGAPEAGLADLRESLGRAVAMADAHGQFLAHYHLWKTHDRLGDAEAARFHREASLHFIRSVDEAGPEADEVRALARERSSPQ